MQEPAFPADEAHRLGALHALGILDSAPEERFDRITRVAQRLFEVPIALVSLVDANRQWFKSCQGLGARETPRSISFCGHAILGDATLVVPDALADARFADNPLVTGEPHIRFYAGHPLRVADGSRVGTLCLIDRQPRTLAPEELALLADLAAMVERELNQQTLAEAIASAQASHLALQQSQRQLQDVVASSPTVTYTLDIDARGARATWVSPNLQRFLGFDAAQTLLQPDWWLEQVHPADRAAAGQAGARLREQGHVVQRYRIRNRAGQYIWVNDELQLMPGEGGTHKAIGSWSDVTRQQESEHQLQQAHGLLEAIRRVQSGHIGRASAQVVFEELLATLLEFGASEYGFIGEVLARADGSPYLKAHAITNIAWDEATRRFYADNAPTGMEFSNLKTLFGAVLTTAEPVIANQPASDPRRGGLPPGHPPLNAFLGLPIKVGGRMVGMIGIANRAGGYDQQLIDLLDPLISTIGQLIEARRAQADYQAARERAERLALVASKTTNGVVITDAAGRVQWINEGFSRITGYTLPQMQGRKPGEVLQGAATDAAAVARMRQALQQAESCDVDLINYSRAGRPYWINIRLDPLRADDGQLQGFLAIETDISERKQTETALAESARHTQAILDHVIDGIVTIDERGVVASFNRAAEQMFGYPAAAVIGRNVNLLMPEPYHDEYQGYLRRHRETGMPRTIGLGREVQGRRRSGELFPMELAISTFSREGQAMYIGLVRDITERKKIDRLKSEFVSTVSHELRTPLTSIKGSLGLVAGGVAGELSPQARSLIDIAYQNSERLVGLINDLLDMEKIESGKMRFDLAPARLMELVEQCVQANQGYAQQHAVRFEIVARVAADVEVLVDEARLAQALSNLLSNAAKFSPAASVVEIGVTQDAGQLRMAVTDHGPGIAEEFRARIFQKFSQADSSDTRQKGGTGLGLSITKVIAEQMGGSIGFESRPGAGSSFWLAFPRWRGEPAQRAAGGG